MAGEIPLFPKPDLSPRRSGSLLLQYTLNYIANPRNDPMALSPPRRLRPRNLAAPLLVAAFTLIFAPACLAAESSVAIESGDGRIRVEMNGELFTEYIYEGYPSPILYPIIGPHGIPMTRDYPMKEGVKGEEPDHPHHRSLWFSHDDVNGVNFWHTTPEREGGRIVQTELIEASAGSSNSTQTRNGETVEQTSDSHATIKTRNKWVSPAGKTVATDTRTITFRPAPHGRIIDYNITLHASEGDLTFGDTKEGTMAIRTNPALRIDKGAHAVNSQGVTGKPIWGTEAKWVDYSGEVNGETAGVAVFDHPKNLRHPTTWHARHYGLIAANPFGLHAFQDKPEGTGDWTLPAGESRTFRYRFYFHEGGAEQMNIEEAYQSYAESNGGRAE